MNMRKISKKFGVPYQTIFRWKKEGWRKKILEYLKDISYLEEKTKQKIEKLFKKNELKAIIASYKSFSKNTVQNEEFYKDENAFELLIEDRFLYEPAILLTYKPDSIELEDFKNILINKLKTLCQFEKYILYRICEEL